MKQIGRKLKNVIYIAVAATLASVLIILTSCSNTSDDYSPVTDSSYSTTDICSVDSLDSAGSECNSSLYLSSQDDASVSETTATDNPEETETDSYDYTSYSDTESYNDDSDSNIDSYSSDSNSNTDNYSDNSDYDHDSTDGSDSEVSDSSDSTSDDSTSIDSTSVDSTSVDSTSSDMDTSTEDAHVHQYGEWEIVTKPTCLEEGLRQQYCSCGDCNKEIISKLDHDYVATTVDANVDTQGHTAYTCTLCGDSYYDNFTSYLYTKELTFKKPDDGTYYIVTGISSTSVTDIYIPSYYKSTGDSEYLPVKEIGDNAFYDNTSITTVTIGYTVTKIGDKAFSECSALTKVNIPRNLITLDCNCFCRCTYLSEIYYDAVCITEVGSLAFAQAGKDTSLTVYISENVESIPQDLFNITTNGMQAYIEAIIFDENCSADIGKNAFYNIQNIKTIVLSIHTTTDNSYAFGDTKQACIYFLGTQEQWNSSTLSDMSFAKNALEIYYYSGTYAKGCWYFDDDGKIILW